MKEPMNMPWIIRITLGVFLSMAGCSNRSSPLLVINEVLPSNTNHCTDEVNERNDWVELYNLGDEAINLQGFSLTDDSANPRKSVIPEGVSIEAKSVLLFWADGTPEQGKTHLSFKFKAKGEGILLYDPDEKQVDAFRWNNAVSDVSYARIPDGTGSFELCATPTCGVTNGTASSN